MSGEASPSPGRGGPCQGARFATFEQPAVTEPQQIPGPRQHQPTAGLFSTDSRPQVTCVGQEVTPAGYQAPQVENHLTGERLQVENGKQ